jgi:hypothetical protein
MKQKPKGPGLKKAPRSKKEEVRKVLREAVSQSPEFLIRLVGKRKADSLSASGSMPRYRHD